MQNTVGLSRNAANRRGAVHRVVQKGMKQVITRRLFAAGLAGAGISAFHAAHAADAEEPLRIGWIQALTGANASSGIGFNRGILFRVDQINAAGGIKGRKIELITRDTQGDPTKAVNAAQEMISRHNVFGILGPSNSGETLAVTPIIARADVPQLHAGTVDSLIDPAKFPNAFRGATSLAQWIEASSRYLVDVRKLKKIAVLGDTSAYGTFSVQGAVEDLKKRGVTVTYQALIDLNQTDVTVDMTRSKDSGADGLALWTTSAGLLSRLLNKRGDLSWNVPVVGHPSLGAGEVGHLLTRPDNWKEVYQVGFRSCSFDAAGKLPPRTAAFVTDLAKAKVQVDDTVLWYLAWGVDMIDLLTTGYETTGSTDHKAIIGYLNSLRKYPGLYGDYTFTPTDHNGYPSDEVVMSQANTFRDGAYTIAPGY
jgi:branched-chain amino acid transport system substrate-binding protein